MIIFSLIFSENSKCIKKNVISLNFISDNQHFEHFFYRNRLRYRLRSKILHQNVLNFLKQKSLNSQFYQTSFTQPKHPLHISLFFSVLKQTTF